MGEPPLVRLTFFLIFLREYGLHYLLSTQDWSSRLNLFFSNRDGKNVCVIQTTDGQPVCWPSCKLRLLAQVAATVARISKYFDICQRSLRCVRFHLQPVCDFWRCFKILRWSSNKNRKSHTFTLELNGVACQVVICLSVASIGTYCHRFHLFSTHSQSE